MRILLLGIIFIIILAIVYYLIWSAIKYRLKLQDELWKENNKLKELEWEARVLEQKIKFREDSMFKHEEVKELQKELDSVNKIIKNIKENV